MDTGLKTKAKKMIIWWSRHHLNVLSAIKLGHEFTDKIILSSRIFLKNTWYIFLDESSLKLKLLTIFSLSIYCLGAELESRNRLGSKSCSRLVSPTIPPLNKPAVSSKPIIYIWEKWLQLVLELIFIER